MDAGKKDPEWQPAGQAIKKLLDYCAAAAPYEHVFDIPDFKGYHGVQLHDNKQTITAFKGKMEITTGNKTVLKTDLGRQLEQMVLLDAPEQFKPIALNQLTTDFD